MGINDNMTIVGKDAADESFARILLHFCIIHANEKGQPEGQDLADATASSGSSGGDKVNRQRNLRPIKVL